MKPMSTKEYRRVLDALGMNIRQSAEFMGVSRSQASARYNGRAEIPSEAARLLRLTYRITQGGDVNLDQLIALASQSIDLV